VATSSRTYRTRSRSTSLSLANETKSPAPLSRARRSHSSTMASSNQSTDSEQDSTAAPATSDSIDQWDFSIYPQTTPVHFIVLPLFLNNSIEYFVHFIPFPKCNRYVHVCSSYFSLSVRSLSLASKWFLFILYVCLSICHRKREREMNFVNMIYFVYTLTKSNMFICCCVVHVWRFILLRDSQLQWRWLTQISFMYLVPFGFSLCTISRSYSS
jgi:hypothetical protein